LKSALRECHFRPTPEKVVWREWEGLFAVFCCIDESTHFIDPVSSAVLDRLNSAGNPVSFDNLVSFVLSECGQDADSSQIVQLLDERLPQLQRIGLVEAIPKS
jgi:hypothetical protein